MNNRIGNTELVTRFRYHAASQDQIARMATLREKCLELAVMIDGFCPHSREKSSALSSLDLVMYQANASIVRREKA